jgi:hypothetical protein
LVTFIEIKVKKTPGNCFITSRTQQPNPSIQARLGKLNIKGGRKTLRIVTIILFTSDCFNCLDEELKAAVRSYSKKPWLLKQECGAALQKHELETAYMSGCGNDGWGREEEI